MYIWAAVTVSQGYPKQNIKTPMMLEGDIFGGYGDAVEERQMGIDSNILFYICIKFLKQIFKGKKK